MNTSDTDISDTSADFELSSGLTTDSSDTDISLSSSEESADVTKKEKPKKEIVSKKVSTKSLFKKTTNKFKAFRRFLSRFKSVQSIFLLIATVFFKFGLESLTVAVSLIIIKRLPSEVSVTMLSVSIVLYNISQSVCVLLLDFFLQCFRASFLLGLALFVMTVNVVIILLVEIGSGGRFVHPIKEGWPGLPYLIIPVQIILGGCYGLVEVLRKYIAPLIVFENEKGNNNNNVGNGEPSSVSNDDTKNADLERKKLERLNSMIHVCYEISGTIGAYFAGFMVKVFGEVFCMIHIPVLFLIAGVCAILILHPSPQSKKKTLSSLYTSSPSTNNNNGKKKTSRSEYVKKFIRVTIIEGFYEYKRNVWKGMKTVVCDCRLNFLFLSLLIPQVCHRLKEAIIVPVYAKEMMERDFFVGIFTGSSNLGELIGASVVLLFTVVFPKTRKWMVIVFLTLSGISLNLLWAYPLIPWKQIPEETSPNAFYGASVGLNAIICLASVCYVMSDIVLLSYLQTQVKDKKILGSVMGFMFIVYVIILTILILVVGKIIDVVREMYNPNLAFMVVTGVISFLSILVILGGPMLLCGERRFQKQQEEQKKLMKEIDDVIGDQNKLNTSYIGSSSEEDEIIEIEDVK